MIVISRGAQKKREKRKEYVLSITDIRSVRYVGEHMKHFDQLRYIKQQIRHNQSDWGCRGGGRRLKLKQEGTNKQNEMFRKLAEQMFPIYRCLFRVSCSFFRKYLELLPC